MYTTLFQCVFITDNKLKKHNFAVTHKLKKGFLIIAIGLPCSLLSILFVCSYFII